eukprot:30861-Pelagococcus_subviridis.AAC.13
MDCASSSPSCTGSPSRKSRNFSTALKLPLFTTHPATMFALFPRRPLRSKTCRTSASPKTSSCRRSGAEGRCSARSDGGVESKGVRSGAERRRGVSGLKPWDPGRRDAPGDKVLEKRRSARERGPAQELADGVEEVVDDFPVHDDDAGVFRRFFDDVRDLDVEREDGPADRGRERDVALADRADADVDHLDADGGRPQPEQRISHRLGGALDVRLDDGAQVAVHALRGSRVRVVVDLEVEQIPERAILVRLVHRPRFHALSAQLALVGHLFYVRLAAFAERRVRVLEDKLPVVADG